MNWVYEINVRSLFELQVCKARVPSRREQSARDAHCCDFVRVTQVVVAMTECDRTVAVVGFVPTVACLDECVA